MDENYNICCGKLPEFGFRNTDDFPLGYYKTDEERAYIIYAGYEDLKLFRVQVSRTREGKADDLYFEHFAGRLSERGDILLDESGDDVGWGWDVVHSWSHIPH